MAVVGSGPAGLTAAIEASRLGCKRVTVIDENFVTGGQLFKQIHKFFGSKDHYAGIRGFRIGELLLKQMSDLGVETITNTAIVGLFDAQADVKRLVTAGTRRVGEVLSKKVLVASGAIENTASFPGWTLPGVIGVGAAQTLMNIYRVPPGQQVLVLGAGNVGLIVAYQMLQAGIEVVGLVEAMPRIGGYQVHADKIRRMGVPILLSHTVKAVIGKDCVEKVVVVGLDKKWKEVPGSAKTFDADALCLAVGLAPNTELTRLAGCKHSFSRELGGLVPLHSERMETTVDGIYVAGDAAGIEEASVAIDEGRLVGTSLAEDLGMISSESVAKTSKEIWIRLNELRSDFFGEPRKKAKTLLVEGYWKMKGKQLGCEKRWFTEINEERAPPTKASRSAPGTKSGEKRKGPMAIVECYQQIPCNACETACNFGAINVGFPMTNLPDLDLSRCKGCGICVAKCPGLAVFVVDTSYSEKEATISLPYELLPIPEVGQEAEVLGKSGKPVCKGKVIRVVHTRDFDETRVVTISVPKECAAEARFIRLFKRMAK
jgi:NADPH-dependent 2,4-dienoyl-CoA reductase/sulfur reductase-like enzyme/Fe-S-cluster-containing hydrogenase component 2